MRPNTDTDVLRRVAPDPATGCLLWTGPLDRDGFPQTAKIRGRSVRPHRLAWESARGPIPPGLDVRHTCGAPHCLAPEHLYLGVYGGRPERSLENRFAECVTPEPNTGCLLWAAGSNKDGYGQIKIGGRGGRTTLAHRVAWELVNGPIPPGMDVLHHCDNPACVRAEPGDRGHLFLGTNADNAADRDAKGRTARGPRLSAAIREGRARHPESQVRGERHGRRKLTEAQVLGVIHRLAAGESQASVAAHLGVSRSTVNLIALGKKWAHVPRPAT